MNLEAKVLVGDAREMLAKLSERRLSEAAGMFASVVIQ